MAEVTGSVLAAILDRLTYPGPGAVFKEWISGDQARVTLVAAAQAPDGEGPRYPQPHWAKTVARTIAERAMHAEAEGVGGGAVRDIQRITGEFCDTPATFPIPLPIPGPYRWWPELCAPEGALLGVDLLVVGGQFRQAADATGDTPVGSALSTAAGHLTEEGLRRLAAESITDSKHEMRVAVGLVHG
jgi:hypothetical protein